MRRNLVLIGAVGVGVLLIGIDSSSDSRIRAVSALSAESWPHKSGIQYHLMRASRHFDSLTALMQQNPDYEAIYAGGRTMFKETCVVSPATPGCSASSDTSLRRHVERIGTDAVVRHDGYLLFGLGGICVGDIVFDYGLADVEDGGSELPICKERPELDDRERCFLPLDERWHIFYWRFENVDYCD